MAECWDCGAERGDASFCTSCSKIQPVPRDRNFFDALSLPQQMGLDRQAVDKQFREVSKLVHPDRFSQASAVERRLALEHTTLINDAHRTLKDPQSRAEYLLALEGVEIGDEEERVDDPELLMLMLELQEKTQSSEDEDELETMLTDVKGRRRAILESVGRYFDDRDGNQESVKKALHELRFVMRLGERVEQRLEEL